MTNKTVLSLFRIWCGYGIWLTEDEHKRLTNHINSKNLERKEFQDLWKKLTVKQFIKSRSILRN